MILKVGSTGQAVKEIQHALGITADGVFGEQTKAVVMKYQEKNNLIVDGIVGDETYGMLIDITTDRQGFDDSVEDTDGKIDMLGTYDSAECLVIDRAYLDTDEYVRDYGKIDPLGVFIHHTAGWDNPYSTINSWNSDSRGRVATQYVVGGLNIKGKTKHDGTVVECFPDNYLGWHLGKVGGFAISKFSVGIELNNFGYLTEKNGKYYTYVGGEVPVEQVCDLGFKFRGYQYWHKYSDAQLDSLKLLLQHIAKVYPKTDMSKGIPALLKNGASPAEAFEFNEDAYNAKSFGMWTHTSVRKDKFDCSPQPALIEVIKSFQ